MFPDIFNDDAFSLQTLTAVVNSVDTLPGRAGALAFAGAAEPLATTAASIESDGYSLRLIQTSKRGAPAPKEPAAPRRTIKAVQIPHIQLEDTVNSSSIQNVRAIGALELQAFRSVVDRQVTHMTQNMDLTLEHMRLGALKGRVLDADGTELVDLYQLFGVSEPDPIDFSPAFVSSAPTDPLDALRAQCQQVIRYMKRNVKAPWSAGARVWALCGDNFFDRLVNSIGVKETAQATALAKLTLGSNYAFSTFEFADIVWENYQGTDDNDTVAIDTNDCRFIVTGIPGLYIEYYAPGDFIDAANQLALPRYARLGGDPSGMNRFVTAHTQMNPLPICTRPLTLVRGISQGSPTAEDQH